MAGDWIKMRGNLWDDPRVSALVDATDSSEAAVVGALYWLWAAADQHTENGHMPGLTTRQIDRKVGIQGFAAALCSIGWLVDQSDGVTIINFEEHNGSSAKRRATDAQRKATVRNVSADDADIPRKSGGQDADDLRRIAELEKEKEKEKKEEGRPRKSAASIARPDDVSEQTWADWCELRAKKKTTVSETAIRDARREAAKAGVPLEQFMSAWVGRGSQGFKADWMQDHSRAPPAETAYARQQREKYEILAPSIAASNPNRPAPHAYEILEVMTEKRNLEIANGRTG